MNGNKAEKRSKSVGDDNKLGNVWAGRREGRKNRMGWYGNIYHAIPYYTIYIGWTTP